MPVLSMDAERAAGQIVEALRRGEAERTLSLPATLLSRFNGLFPGTTSNILGLVNRYILPGPPDQPENGSRSGRTPAVRGAEVDPAIASKPFRLLTSWSRSAAGRFQSGSHGVG
jgi:hypothetical protein